jgi:hypothetical protein
VLALVHRFILSVVPLLVSLLVPLVVPLLVISALLLGGILSMQAAPWSLQMENEYE